MGVGSQPGPEPSLIIAIAATSVRDGRGAGWKCSAAPGAGSRGRDMARSPGQLSRPHPDTVAMPKRGKRLKFRAHDACSGRGGRGAGSGGRGGWAAGSDGRRLHREGLGRLYPKSEVALALCSVSVTVADYANSDPAVVRSGRVKKAVANAVQQEGRFSRIFLVPRP